MVTWCVQCCVVNNCRSLRRCLTACPARWAFLSAGKPHAVVDVGKFCSLTRKQVVSSDWWKIINEKRSQFASTYCVQGWQGKAYATAIAPANTDTQHCTRRLWRTLTTGVGEKLHAACPGMSMFSFWLRICCGKTTESVHCTITGPRLCMCHRPSARTLQHVTVLIWNIYPINVLV